jgi:hypothetical protein
MAIAVSIISRAVDDFVFVVATAAIVEPPCTARVGVGGSVSVRVLAVAVDVVLQGVANFCVAIKAFVIQTFK